MSGQASFSLRGRNPDVLTCIANLSNDEVFTPPEFANRMLDTLAEAWAVNNGGADLWAGSSVRFLDPFTKSGVFLREIASRLTKGLVGEIPDLQKRVDHILTKQVFGIGITYLTSLLARRSLYCSKHAKGPHSIAKGFATEAGNIWFERTVLLIMLDSGLRPGEIFRMRWENIHWDKGLIFNPRGKSRKSRRYVPLTERVTAALLTSKEGVNEGWVFPSKKARSGHITDREVSKQWLEAKRLAGVPESVVLYCARHRFSTDAMEGTGNVMAVMDAMGHQSVNTTRIYSHSNVRRIREAIERRNQQLSATVQ